MKQHQSEQLRFQVVNCNSSPDHRCCKYAEEEGEKEDEKPEEAAKDAPVEQEEQVLIQSTMFSV